MKKSTLEMSHSEWLLDRRKGLGGSDIATVLGLNKYRSPYQLWLDKTGQVDIKEDEQSEPAYWGNVLEEVVAKEFQERTDKKVMRRNQVFEHPLHPFLRANIDRWVVGENAILECKTASSFLAKEWEGEEIPLGYICQVQHYMNVLNCDKAYIAVLIGGQKFVWKELKRDQELIDMITERCVEFWEENVIKGIEPPIDGSKAATDFLNEHYSEEGTQETTLPSEFDELIEYRKQLKADGDLIKEKIDEVDNKIKSEMGKRDAVIGITSNFVISWKSFSTNRLNKKLLAEKYPDAAKDPDVYQTSNSKRMTIKGIG